MLIFFCPLFFFLRKASYPRRKQEIFTCGARVAGLSLKKSVELFLHAQTRATCTMPNANPVYVFAAP